MRNAAHAAPALPALHDGGRGWTYGEMDEEVDRLARALIASGLPAGARVAVLVAEGANQVFALHAVPRAGLVVAPLSRRLTSWELSTALLKLEAVGVLVDGDTSALASSAVEQAGRSIPLLTIDLRRSRDGVSNDVRHPVSSPARPPESAASREWAVLWTSGTAGRARGVALSAENLQASSAASRERLSLEPGDRWCLSLSAAHVGGLALVVRAAFTRAVVVATGAFSAEGFNALTDAGARDPRFSRADHAPPGAEQPRRPALSSRASLRSGGRGESASRARGAGDRRRIPRRPHVRPY